MRIVSLVPSLTDAVAQLGSAEDLVGVTEWCTSGAPDGAVRIGGTKNPAVADIVALQPELVLANTEENKPSSLDELREAGLAVEEFYPRAVRDVPPMLRRLGQLTDAAERGAQLAQDVQDAIDEAAWPADLERVMALTLVWRKPWMGLGAQTYADDLLWQAGFGNVLSGFDEPYPRLEEGLVFGQDVVLLPSEPYEFGPADLEAVAALAGPGPTEFVDGQALTWHGPRTADALRTFGELARRLADPA
ncbi:helical backbone metal receptor [Euzebya tangerina]|uniref:helical backbone metal receptor n=1 Tax=Euzebya tangerina TaxID=591198 RepID=UPI000E310D03|nr:helical backbone metal receptor [Euzebya tangerina]